MARDLRRHVLLDHLPGFRQVGIVLPHQLPPREEAVEEVVEDLPHDLPVFKHGIGHPGLVVGILGQVGLEERKCPQKFRLIAQRPGEGHVLLGVGSQKLVGEGGGGVGELGLLGAEVPGIKQLRERVRCEHGGHRDVLEETFHLQLIPSLIEIEREDDRPVGEGLHVLAVDMGVVLLEDEGVVGEEALGGVPPHPHHNPGLPLFRQLGEGDPGNVAGPQPVPEFPVPFDGRLRRVLHELPGSRLFEGRRRGPESGGEMRAGDHVEAQRVPPGAVALEPEDRVVGLDPPLQGPDLIVIVLRHVSTALAVLAHELDGDVPSAGVLGDDPAGPDRLDVPGNLFQGGVLEVIIGDPQLEEEPGHLLPHPLGGKIPPAQNQRLDLLQLLKREGNVRSDLLQRRQ